MPAIAHLAILAIAARQRPTLLHQVWVAEKSIYVLEEPQFSSHETIRRFVETSRGIEQAGPTLTLSEHVIGTGPGLGDSLLLFCQKAGHSFKLLRVAKSSVRQVSDLSSFHGNLLDPQIALSETKDYIELEDPDTEGDSGELRIWLYKRALVGPLRTDIGKRRFPINSHVTASLAWSPFGANGHESTNCEVFFNGDGFIYRGFEANHGKVSLSGNNPSSIAPIMSLSSRATALLLRKDEKQWIAVFDKTDQYVEHRQVQVWRPAGNEALCDGRDLPDDGTNALFKATGEAPVFADTHGRFWIWSKGHVFKRLNLKLVRTEVL